MISKLRTIIWFFRNPVYLSQVTQIVKRKFNFKGDRHGETDAIQWCKENVLEESEVLRLLTGKIPKKPLETIFPEYFHYAEAAVKNTPMQLGGPGGINFLYYLAEHLKPTSVFETGVAYGWSSLALLLAIRKLPDSRVISVDMPYAKMGNDKFVGCVVHSELRKNWELLRMPDRKGVPKAIAQTRQFDLIHYDSDKSYSGRKWAYPLLWKHLKSGGVFISDDIQDNIGFKEFCQENDQMPYIFENDNKYVGVIVKPNT
jgi:predicted O-methyltransferase YrrM